jgi:hypothetical protein
MSTRVPCVKTLWCHFPVGIYLVAIAENFLYNRDSYHGEIVEHYSNEELQFAAAEVGQSS